MLPVEHTCELHGVHMHLHVCCACVGVHVCGHFCALCVHGDMWSPCWQECACMGMWGVRVCELCTHAHPCGLSQRPGCVSSLRAVKMLRFPW